MWQITWMLGFLPQWLWNALLIVGVLGLLAAWVLKFVPFVSTYRLPIQVASVLITVVSVWFLGAAANEEKWQAEIKRLEAAVKKGEEDARTLNDQLTHEIEEKKKLAEQKNKEIIKYIDRWNTREILKEVQGPERVRIEEVIKYIENCPVPKEFIDLHNQATKGNKK